MRPPSRHRHASIDVRAVTPGQVVLSEFTLPEVAEGLGVAESTAWRWAQARPKGTGGLIPSTYHVPLLRLACRLGRDLTAEDLVLGRPA